MQRRQHVLCHDEQVSGLCGAHALNNLLQRPLYGPSDLAATARSIDQDEQNLLIEQGALPAALTSLPQQSEHMDSVAGCFSIEVLTRALAQHGFQLLNINHESIVVTVSQAPEMEQGFIVHRGAHWFALRKLCGSWWNLDSKLLSPQYIAPGKLATFLKEQQSAQTLVFTVRGSPLPLPLPAVPPQPSTVLCCTTI